MAPQPYETTFYEVMWQTHSSGAPYPMPWWLQSYFRNWPGDTSGMFGSKEAALASNALYRYWNMVGVKDAHQETLVGQAGEIEPVYERYAVTFFVLADGSTVVGAQKHAAVLNRLVVREAGPGPKAGQLGIAVIPVKPSGFVRTLKNGDPAEALLLSYLRYRPGENRLETNSGSGPVFLTPPASFGLYGNEDNTSLRAAFGTTRPGRPTAPI